MTNINTETNAIEEKDRKYQEIEKLKADIQEVLLTIQQVQKTTKKLQKQNRIKSTEITESEEEHRVNQIEFDSMKEEISNEPNVSKCDTQVKCISFSNDISWESLRNLTINKFDKLTNNDKSFVKIIKSLFFPSLETISDIFSNKATTAEWKKHINNLQSVINNQKVISFGEYLFKENLRFSKDIHNYYEKILLFGKDFDKEHKQRITRNFFDKYGSDIITSIKNRYDLSPEEARIFTIYLACMSDFDKNVLGFDYTSMHEFFQNAWMKINNNQDEFRGKQQIVIEAQKQIVHSDFSRFKTGVTSGFDSYFVLLNKDKFELWFSEQKCGRGHSICKNYKDINDPLHKSVFNLAQKRTNKKFRDLLQKTGFTIEQIIDFSVALFKRYTYYYDSLGNNFLLKMNFSKYKHDLIFGLERNEVSDAKQLTKKLIKSAKDNHRLIALIQNGFTINEDQKVINYLEIMNRKKQPIRVFGEIFTFKPIRNEKNEYILSVEGYSEKLLKRLKKTDSKLNPEPYDKLNSVIRSISLRKNCRISKILSSSKYVESLLSNYNELLYAIYQYLSDSKNFISFELLKEGKTFVCSEIASEEISAIKEWLEKNQRMYSAIPYTINYFWRLPFFGKLREISKNDNTKMSKTNELAFKRLFSYNDKDVLKFLSDISAPNFSEEEYEKRVKSNPEYSFIFSILYLLKGNTWLKLRKNLFEQGDMLRALILIDEQGLPFRVFGEDKKLKPVENPYLNIKVDFNKILSNNRLLDRNILSTFPIAIKSGKTEKRYPELKFRFCRTDGKRAGEKGKKARELHIERIREKLGHIEEVDDMIDVLYSKPAISFNLLRGENREIMMKLFIYLLFEYHEVWKEFDNSLMKHLNENIPFTTENMVLSNSFTNAEWGISVKSIKEDTDGRWLIHYIVKDKTTKAFERKIKVLPTFVNIINKNTSNEKLGHMKKLTLFCNHNSLYIQVLETLRSEIMPLVLIDDEEGIDSKMSYEWKNIIDWMEKACI